MATYHNTFLAAGDKARHIIANYKVDSGATLFGILNHCDFPDKNNRMKANDYLRMVSGDNIHHRVGNKIITIDEGQSFVSVIERVGEYEPA